MHTSFISHKRGLYFWLAVALSGLSIAIYLLHQPVPEPNGGTWAGYGLGTVAALMILWLMYLGRRKRNFEHGWGTVRGWLSAHVYFGCALIVVATLHTGFQFGMNIHTLAYLLMLLVIGSGLFGVWAYRTYPEMRNEIKRSQTLDDVFGYLENVDERLVKKIAGVEDEIREVVTSAIERSQVGGGYLDQLLSLDNSQVVINEVVVSNRKQERLIAWLVDRMSRAQGDQLDQLATIIEDCATRQRLLRTIRADIRMHGLQEVWLMLHIPLSFALLAALIAHVASVFIYW